MNEVDIDEDLQDEWINNIKKLIRITKFRLWFRIEQVIRHQERDI